MILKRIILLLVINLLLINISFCQEVKSESINYSKTSTNHYINDYPEGIYLTIDDFLNKKFTSDISLKRVRIDDYKYITKEDIIDNVFFFQIYDDTKLTKVFAVSFEGNLYIQQKYLHKYAKDGNKNEEGNNPNSYHRVLKDGKFLYMEGIFANAWAKGFAYGGGSAVGGFIGFAVGTGIGNSLDKLKGVVFDLEKREFDFFKNCEDFNLFLIEKKYDDKFQCNCNGRNIDINIVRNTMDKIIK